MKKIIACFALCTMLLPMLCPAASAQEDIAPFELKAKSAVLMDAATGQVLYAKNADTPLPPASVTKVMTLLLVMEAIDSGALSLSDMVTVSENAASMGGSQVFLEPNEQLTAEEMLKSVVVSSANDAAVALGERVCGSEAAFIQRMNERAAELGMNNTNFENATGLDDDVTNHTISAYDIALVSRELITKHPLILQYTTIWMDTIRNGSFGLSNTNRLIRFYPGATGLKTGSTSKAGFCISATAQRDGMHLIAVIMGSATRDERNSAAATLLDWGFSAYAVYSDPGGSAGELKVQGGVKQTCALEYPPFSALLPRGREKKITVEKNIPEVAAAPLRQGDEVGSIRYMCEGEEIGSVPVTAAETVEKISYPGLLLRMLKGYCLF